MHNTQTYRQTDYFIIPILRFRQGIQQHNYNAIMINILSPHTAQFPQTKLFHIPLDSGDSCLILLTCLSTNLALTGSVLSPLLPVEPGRSGSSFSPLMHSLPNRPQLTMMSRKAQISVPSISPSIGSHLVSHSQIDRWGQPLESFEKSLKVHTPMSAMAAKLA